MWFEIMFIYCQWLWSVNLQYNQKAMANQMEIIWHDVDNNKCRKKIKQQQTQIDITKTFAIQ